MMLEKKKYPLLIKHGWIEHIQTCGKRWDLPKFVDVLSVNQRRG